MNYIYHSKDQWKTHRIHILFQFVLLFSYPALYHYFDILRNNISLVVTSYTTPIATSSAFIPQY